MPKLANAYQSQAASTGRIKMGPAPELIRSANRLEVGYAGALYEGMSLADLAHVIMSMETEIIPWSAGQRLLAGLLAAHDIAPQDFPLDPALGDVYKNREQYLRAHPAAADAAGWLGAGRARREVSNIGFQSAVRSRLLRLLAALHGLAETTVDRAEEQIATVMPDYTYLQQAQPTTLGHYLLGFVYPMLRDIDRLQSCFERVNRSSGGIGSVNGSRLPLDRQRLAELLGFDGAIHHTRDAMWQADIPIEVTAGVVAVSVNLDRLAEDLQVWSTQEFNLVELADGYARSSVIMPQKKNPYSLAYVRGVANVTIGQLVAMASVGRTPSGQPDNRIFAYGDVPRTIEQVTETVQLMSGVLRTLRVHGERMAHRAGLGYSQATDLADAIMLSAGLPYETAHRVVGHLVATAIADEVPAEQFSVTMIDRAAEAVVGHGLDLSPDLLAEVLDPRAIVATRTGLGGAAPAPMRAMIAECRDRLHRAQGWREETERRLQSAELGLVGLARKLVESAPPGPRGQRQLPG